MSAKKNCFCPDEKNIKRGMLEYLFWQAVHVFFFFLACEKKNACSLNLYKLENNENTINFLYYIQLHILKFVVPSGNFRKLAMLCKLIN